MGKVLGHATEEMVPKKKVEEEIDILTKEFKKRLINRSIWEISRSFILKFIDNMLQN